MNEFVCSICHQVDEKNFLLNDRTLYVDGYPKYDDHWKIMIVGGIGITKGGFPVQYICKDCLGDLIKKGHEERKAIGNQNKQIEEHPKEERKEIPARYSRMDIYSPKGTKVIYFFPFNGDSLDHEYAEKYLTLDKIYTVDHTEVHNWDTDVYLEEIPGIGFNSVLFAQA